MKHSAPELFDLIYRFYPRGVARPGGVAHLEANILPGGAIDWGPGVQIGDPRYHDTEEHLRLVAARIHAGTGAAYDAWRAMLARLRARFPDCRVTNQAFHLASGSWDAAYVADLELPVRAPDNAQHALGFMVSFLAPYYVIYSERVFSLDVRDEHSAKQRCETAGEVRFELTSDEDPYARGLAQEIESTYGAVPMPPDVGGLRVPDVELGTRAMGEATIYDCLFSEHRGR